MGLTETDSHNKLSNKMKPVIYFSLLSPFFIVIRFPEIIFAIYLLPTQYSAICNKYDIIKGFPLYYLLFILVILIIFHLIHQRTQFDIPKQLSIPLISLGILMLVSLFYTPNISYGIEKVTEFFSLTLLSCVAPLFFFRKKNNFQLFLKTFLWFGGLLGLLLLFSHPYPLLLLNLNTDHSKYYPEFKTLIGTNYIAIQQIFGISALISFFFLIEKYATIKSKGIYLFALFFYSGCLFYSAGKSAVLAYMFTFFIFILSIFVRIRNNRIIIDRRLIKFIAFGFLSGALLLVTIGWPVLLRAKATLSQEHYSWTERATNADIATQLFRKNPFIGVGIGGYSVFTESIHGKEKFIYPHNIILELASELGVAGLTLFLILIFYTLKNIFYYRTKYEKKNFLFYPSLLLSLLIFTFLISLTSGNINNHLLFSWIGTSFTLEKITTSNLK